MPSKNPRVSVVLPPSVAATLAALSEETGESVSSLVRGILVQIEPGLQRMLHLVMATQAARGEIGHGVSESMKRVVDDLEDALAGAEVHRSAVVCDLVEGAERVDGRMRARREGRRSGGAATKADKSGARVSTDPRLVTRGSGDHKSYK